MSRWYCPTETVADLLVVIENDDHVGVQESSVIHGLVRHATGDGAVADHCNIVVLPLLQPTL